MLIHTLVLVMDGSAVLPSCLLDLLLEPPENQLIVPPEPVVEPSIPLVSSCLAANCRQKMAWLRRSREDHSRGGIQPLNLRDL